MKHIFVPKNPIEIDVESLILQTKWPQLVKALLKYRKTIHDNPSIKENPYIARVCQNYNGKRWKSVKECLDLFIDMGFTAEFNDSVAMECALHLNDGYLFNWAKKHNFKTTCERIVQWVDDGWDDGLGGIPVTVNKIKRLCKASNCPNIQYLVAAYDLLKNSNVDMDYCNLDSNGFVLSLERVFEKYEIGACVTTYRIAPELHFSSLGEVITEARHLSKVKKASENMTSGNREIIDQFCEQQRSKIERRALHDKTVNIKSSEHRTRL